MECIIGTSLHKVLVSRQFTIYQLTNTIIYDLPRRIQLHKPKLFPIVVLRGPMNPFEILSFLDTTHLGLPRKYSLGCYSLMRRLTYFMRSEALIFYTNGDPPILRIPSNDDLERNLILTLLVNRITIIIAVRYTDPDIIDTETLGYLRGFTAGYGRLPVTIDVNDLFHQLGYLSNLWSNSDQPIRQTVIDQLGSFYHEIDDPHRRTLRSYVTSVLEKTTYRRP